MKVICVMCINTAEFDDPPKDGKYLCPSCYEKVKAKFEETHPGQSLRLKEDTNPEHKMLLEACKVRCPKCGSTWVTSLGVEWCNCLNCEQKLDPKKHIVAESENEVN